MLAIIPISFRYIVDCIHCEIFVWKKCNSENMARMCDRPFPTDLEPQYQATRKKTFMFQRCEIKPKIQAKKQKNFIYSVWVGLIKLDDSLVTDIMVSLKKNLTWTFESTFALSNRHPSYSSNLFFSAMVKYSFNKI